MKAAAPAVPSFPTGAGGQRLSETMPEPRFHLTTLENGLQVATFPMPWLHEVGVTLFVRAGSRFERPTEAGIAHFLEHMLFKGTESIPDPTLLHAHLEAMAADMNAATGQESNAYWLSLPPEWLEEGFLAFCEIFTKPVFDGLQTERRVILAEMREDQNDQGELTNPTVLGGERLWPGHPLARSVLGTPESLAAIDRRALRDYLERLYTGRNMALAFCGPLEHDQSLRLARQALGGVPAGRAARSPAPPPMPPGPHWVAVNDQTSQFSLTLYFRTRGYRDPDFYRVVSLRRLLDDGFSSRLQATVREQQGLVYDVWSSYTGFCDTGALEVGATVSPEHLHEVVEALWRELDRLCREPPGEAEWSRLLTRWRASLAGSLDRPSELVERYVADHLFGAMESLSDSWRRVRELEAGAVPGFARALFQSPNLVVVLVGPRAREAIHQVRGRWEALTGGAGSGGPAPAASRRPRGRRAPVSMTEGGDGAT